MQPTQKDGGDLVALDFSKEAVARAVFKAATENPLVIWPAALGVIGTTAALTGLAPWWVALLLLVGPGVFGAKYFLRYDAEAENYLKAMRDLQRRVVAEMPARLRASLEEAGSVRGLAQLDELENSFADFQQLLLRKFSTRGMTLGRFLGSAEQVRAGALYKLQMVLDQMKAVESIPADLETKLERQAQNDEAARLIQERANHRKEALQVIEHLHTDVEASLTRLSEISVRIANVGMGEDEEVKFETYLGELQALATQASTFHKET
jgi:vacuolar-type H+-ATPase subunit I/STV1